MQDRMMSSALQGACLKACSTAALQCHLITQQNNFRRALHILLCSRVLLADLACPTCGRAPARKQRVMQLHAHTCAVTRRCCVALGPQPHGGFAPAGKLPLRIWHAQQAPLHDRRAVSASFDDAETSRDGNLSLPGLATPAEGAVSSVGAGVPPEASQPDHAEVTLRSDPWAWRKQQLSQMGRFCGMSQHGSRSRACICTEANARSGASC